VVCGKPYYPAWKVDPAYAGGGIKRSVEDGVSVIRLPIYVPSNPDGRRRVLHHASFAARALPVVLVEGRKQRPDVVIGIAPSLVSLTAARAAARAYKAKLWIHVQDFEVEAAFATGLLSPAGRLAKPALAFEEWSLDADRISTISPQMCAKLIERGIAPAKVVEFRNWASIDLVRPLDRPSVLRKEWGIERPYVALYSGNIANKQGIEIVIDAARLLKERDDLQFVICGEGANRARLEAQAADLDNVRFFDLQPMERLSELLGLATVHLLPQIAGAADLVLPSKLTNMLASGRPVLATAEQGTGLAQEVEGCGVITAPGDVAEFKSALVALLNAKSRRTTFGHQARLRAESRWSRQAILSDFSSRIQKLEVVKILSSVELKMEHDRQRVLFIGLAAYEAHGGIQRFNRRVIEALAQLGGPAEAGMLADHLNANQSGTSRIPVHGFAGRRLRFLRYFLGAMWRADVLLVGHINLLPFAALMKMLRPHTKAILFAHGIEIWGDPAFRAPAWYEPWALKSFVDRVAVVSKYSRDRMANAFRLTVAKFVLFPNAVDLIDPPTPAGNSNTVLCVSRLGQGEREKHVDKLIIAFVEVLKVLPKARLVIVGEGPLRSELAALAAELGLSEHVELLGSVDDQQLADAYARAAVFALPSSKEGFGIVYLEAWLRGLPVIGSIHGAGAEVIAQEVDGLLVEPTNISALAKAIKTLLQDSTSATRMAAAGREKVVANYSAATFVGNLRAMIDNG
jgi:colanic acid biosynthesis glycosyl transferase WcaI